MNIADTLVLLRGGGDLATGVAFRLNKAGFPLIVLELARPLVVRRRVALATAVFEGQVKVEDLYGRLARGWTEALELSQSSTIPVLVSPELPGHISDNRTRMREEPKVRRAVSVMIDARMAKRNIDTRIDQAPLVIALGPGFESPVDCHAVVETKRGHGLGRVIWKGRAHPNTGSPGSIAGKGAERVLRAPTDGKVEWHFEIGDQVGRDQVLGAVGGEPVVAPFTGVLRGLIMPGLVVPAGLKIGDLDARKDVEACFTISEKALAVGGGVLEAILTWMRGER